MFKMWPSLAAAPSLPARAPRGLSKMQAKGVVETGARARGFSAGTD